MMSQQTKLKQKILTLSLKAPEITAVCNLLPFNRAEFGVDGTICIFFLASRSTALFHKMSLKCHGGDLWGSRPQPAGKKWAKLV
jgi:hypothetical protein